MRVLAEPATVCLVLANRTSASNAVGALGELDGHHAPADFIAPGLQCRGLFTAPADVNCARVLTAIPPSELPELALGRPHCVSLVSSTAQTLIVPAGAPLSNSKAALSAAQA